MDPQATWNALLEEWMRCNWQEVAELAEALLGWLKKNGFPPETIGERRMGADWNRTLALAVCAFALRRANRVLADPNGIPDDVGFSLSCDTCGNDGPDTHDEAIAEGWTELRYTPAGLSENFLGYCPICRLQEAREVIERQQHG